jgi:hypothetical protein
LGGGVESRFGEKGVESGMEREDAGEPARDPWGCETAAHKLASAPAWPVGLWLLGAGEKFDQSLGGADEVLAAEGICPYRDHGGKMSWPLGGLESVVRSRGHDVKTAQVEGINPTLVDRRIAGPGGSSETTLHDVVSSPGGFPYPFSDHCGPRFLEMAKDRK